VELRSATDKLLALDHTRAGAADMNDMPDFTLPEKAGSVAFRFVRGGETRKESSLARLRNRHTLELTGTN